MRLRHLVIIACACAGCGASAHEPARTVRIAAFNIEVLSTEKILDVDAHGVGRDPQLIAAAEIIREIRPDVLVLNELWHDYGSADLTENARRFVRAYVNRGDDALDFPYAYATACNTGMRSGFDLNGDGVVATDADRGTRAYADDCWGWGMEPGAFSIGLLSRLPIDSAAVRTFRNFRWIDLPGNHVPPGFYPEAALERFPLSSKAHWDVPVRIGEGVIHVLISVPTPGIFDGPEDRNGRRNFDEIKFWAHYLDGDSALVDDAGVRGGLGNEPFVIAGDLNAFASQDSRYGGMVAIEQLLRHPRVRDTGDLLVSEGAGADTSVGPKVHPERHTILAGTFKERLDYVLPSKDLNVVGGGVYWPGPADSAGSARAARASDHRLVWLDLRVSR